MGLDERIYPRSRVACVVVWLLDRMPAVREQVLASYWSPRELDKIKRRAARWAHLFSGEDH